MAATAKTITLIIEHKLKMHSGRYILASWPSAHHLGFCGEHERQTQNLPIFVCLWGWTFYLLLFETLVQRWNGNFVNDQKQKKTKQENIIIFTTAILTAPILVS